MKSTFLITCFIISLIFPNFVFSQEEFLVDSVVTYDVSENGKTLVTHRIVLENNYSTLYATTYTLTLENIEALSVKAYNESGQLYGLETNTDNEKTRIKVSFPDSVLGKGNKRVFYLSYENTNFAVRTGEVWEISIPKLSNEYSFRDYKTVLKVPSAFGFEAYLSPKPESSGEESGKKVYTFSKSELVKTGVTAGFGEFQVFNFNLSYHLENPLPKVAKTEIAIPPDTAFQRVYLNLIEPKPSGIHIDEDGNWIATYQLKARERIDVNVSGNVQIFSGQRPFSKPTDETLSANLRGTTNWQIDEPEIRALASKLVTPRAIYDYVSSTLKYDYGRVRPNVDRLGAKGALLSPNSAICMEFTDLFIAIARAAGIPAREVNGYAYTENPEIQPLSLVADVLHSWPEYWDKEKGAWIPIDPTWASTTGGQNFFDKLDLRHFSFVMHGLDDQKPFPPGSFKLGSNPQKDVFVSFGKLPDSQSNYPQISASLKQGLPFFPSYIDINITNSGSTAFYYLEPTVNFDNKEYYKGIIETLLPFSSYQTRVKVPYSFLAKNTPDKITIQVDGSEVAVPTNKRQIITTSLLALFMAFIVILVTILWKNHKLNFLKIREFIFSKIRKNQSM